MLTEYFFKWQLTGVLCMLNKLYCVSSIICKSVSYTIYWYKLILYIIYILIFIKQFMSCKNAKCICRLYLAVIQWGVQLKPFLAMYLEKEQ